MKKQVPSLLPVLLLLYHLIFSWAAWKVVSEESGDALRYWFVGEDVSRMEWSRFLNPGTDVVKLLTFPLVRYLHLPFWSGFVLFSLFSGWGFLRLWGLVTRIAVGRQWLLALGYCCLLMPNLHFWTSLIGKEALLFVPVVFLTEEIYEKRYYSLRLWGCVLAIGLIRPHVAGLLIVALTGALLWKGGFSLKMKAFITGGAAIILAAFLYLLKEITHAEHGLWTKVSRLYQAHITVLQHTDAYVPLDRYPLPGKIFTVLFRPLPFEESGFYYTAVAFDNLFLLLLSGLALFSGIRNFRKAKNSVFICFSLSFILLFSVMYGYAYANYGLLLRTKIMILPVLFTLCLSIFAQYQQKARPG